MLGEETFSFNKIKCWLAQINNLILKVNGTLIATIFKYAAMMTNDLLPSKYVVSNYKNVFLIEILALVSAIIL